MNIFEKKRKTLPLMNADYTDLRGGNIIPGPDCDWSLTGWVQCMVRSSEKKSSRMASRLSARAQQCVYTIAFDREKDGRWIAEISSLPGVMAYGKTQAEAERKVKALALRVIG